MRLVIKLVAECCEWCAAHTGLRCLMVASHFGGGCPQFIFWYAHAKRAERCYPDVVRRLLLKTDDTRRLHLVGRTKVQEISPCTEYIAWLYQPLLLCFSHALGAM